MMHRKRLCTRGILWLALMVGAAMLVRPVAGQAPAGGDWAGAINLTGWKAYGDNPVAVRMAADAAGNVHVVWASYVEGSQAPAVVYYARWNGTEWSPPMDVLLAPPTGLVLGALAATPDGTLLLAWHSGGSIYLSQTRADEAGNANRWATQRVVDGANPRVAIEPRTGRWYLSYNDFNSVNLIATDDGGVVWSAPAVVWSAPPAAYTPENYAIVAGADGTVHMAWSEHSVRRDWNGEAIWYARWSAWPDGQAVTTEIMRNAASDQPTVDSPALALSGDGTLHLVWNNGVGTTVGRYHRVSYDAGRTWAQTTSIYEGLSGQTKQAGTAIDSTGVFHLLTAAADRSGPSAVRYATWSAGVWSPTYASLWAEEYPGEVPAAALADGNRLHVAWIAQRIFAGESLPSFAVAYTAHTIDAPSVAPVVFPVADNSTANRVSIKASLPTVTAAATTEPASRRVASVGRSPGLQAAPTGWILAAALIPSLFIVAIVSVLAITRREGKS